MVCAAAGGIKGCCVSVRGPRGRQRVNTCQARTVIELPAAKAHNQAGLPNSRVPQQHEFEASDVGHGLRAEGEGAWPRCVTPCGAGANKGVQRRAREESAAATGQTHKGAEQVASAKRPLGPVQQGLGRERSFATHQLPLALAVALASGKWQSRTRVPMGSSAS